MEKRKWLWKRKSSERNLSESESPGSISSCSESHSDEQDASRGSPDDGTQSSEVTSESIIIDDAVKERLKSLTEKLSAALVNVNAKEELVKQHAKVAEEAVAGWEKAENEVAALKQQLEVAVKENLKLEVRVSHLDGALKECVRQLRQARDEQEQRISDAMAKKTGEWELIKAELDGQILELEEKVEASRAETSTSFLEVMERENSSLKRELETLSRDLEILMMERDFSTQVAETASKQQLESIKKIAKLETECRKLQAVTRKPFPANDHRSVLASSSCAKYETDSHSDGGDRMITLDLDACNRKRNCCAASGSDSLASVLISELVNFKNERPTSKTLATCSIEIDMMDDFLEMERLAALADTKISSLSAETEIATQESVSTDNPLKDEVERLTEIVADMEKKLEKIDAEKLKLQRALDDSHVALNASKRMLVESEIQLEELQKELAAASEAKESLEFQLISMEAEARTMSSCVDSLKAENEKERTALTEFKVKCQELESKLQQSTTSNGEVKLKKENLAVAADKLAECQKTIASLGKQLKTLATLEDFLIDTSNIPGFSKKALLSVNGERYMRCNNVNLPKHGADPSGISIESCNRRENCKNVESPPSSTSQTSTNKLHHLSRITMDLGSFSDEAKVFNLQD